MPEIRSTEGPIRLLCAGDLHLGRYPTRVPLDQESLSIDAVWFRMVRYAIGESVDAVVLTGDLADQGHKLFEASFALQRGLEQLQAAGIPVFSVAGNHDYDVLARLHGTLNDGFILLGADGTWERQSLTRNGAPVLELAGWSFTDRYCHGSPLDRLPHRASDVPVVGVLHADLDVPESPYAPVSRAELARTGFSAWLLGHIHVHKLFELGSGIALYPGSLQPLDPGESGAHGACMIEVDGTGRATCTHVPLASVCYDLFEIDVTGQKTAADVRAHIFSRLSDDVERRSLRYPHCEHVAYRLRLTGRTSISAEIDALIPDIVRAARVGSGKITGSVETVIRATSPDIDLTLLSTRNDQPGTVARLLLELTEDAEADCAPRPHHQDLFERLRAATAGIARQYTRLNEAPPCDAELRQMAIAQLTTLLDALVAQHAEVPSTAEVQELV